MAFGFSDILSGGAGLLTGAGGGKAGSLLGKFDPMTKSFVGDKSPKELLFGSERERFTKLDPDLEKSVLRGREAQREGLAGIRALSQEDPRNMIRSRIEKEKRAVQGAKEDALRRLQELRARRGLGSSSVGLGQMRKATQEAGEKTGMIEGSFAERLRNLRRQQLQDLLGASRNVLTTPGASKQFGIQSSPGLAGGIGAVLGGIFGGPAGAQVGAGAGQSLSGTFGPGSFQRS